MLPFFRAGVRVTGSSGSSSAVRGGIVSQMDLESPGTAQLSLFSFFVLGSSGGLPFAGPAIQGVSVA